MTTFKLSKTLTKPDDPEWDLLIKLTLPDDVHSDRKNGFLLSRDALKNALKEYGLDITPGALKLKDYSGIEAFPQFTISLSHTKDCGAALVADRKTFRSVGVDIEHEARVVKDSIRERIAHEQDENLRNIEIWCLKEAAFKALMNTQQFEKPLEFSSIRLGKNKWFHSPSGLSGEWELEVIRPYVVAKAFLEN